MNSLKKMFHKDHKHGQTSSTTSTDERLHQHDHSHTNIYNNDNLTRTNAPVGQEVQRTANVVEPTVKHVNAPVIQEVRHRVETEIVQPVVQRDHIQTRVEQLIQPIVDRQVVPEVHHTVRDQVKEIVHGQPQEVPALNISSNVIDAGIERKRIVAQPLVSERVNQTVRQEVTPVIQREVIQPKVIHREQPIHERIVEKPTITTQTAAPISMEEATRLGFTRRMSGQIRMDILNRNMANMTLTDRERHSNQGVADNTSSVLDNSVGTAALTQPASESSLTALGGTTMPLNQKHHQSNLNYASPSTTTTSTQRTPHLPLL